MKGLYPKIRLFANQEQRAAYAVNPSPSRSLFATDSVDPLPGCSMFATGIIAKDSTNRVFSLHTGGFCRAQAFKDPKAFLFALSELKATEGANLEVFFGLATDRHRTQIGLLL